MRPSGAGSMRAGNADTMSGQWNGWFRTATAKLRYPARNTSVGSIKKRPLRLFSRPETLLRRLIPALIIGLLVMVAVARIATLMDRANSIENSAQLHLATLSQLATARLVDQPELLKSLGSPTVVSTFLEEAVPANLLRPGLSIFLLNANGKVISHLPDNLRLEGIYHGRLVGNAKPLPNGEATRVLLDGITPVLAIEASLGSASGTSARLLLTRTTASIYADWYKSVRLNLALFIAMSMVIFVILYAYFAQGARSRAAESLYTETNTRFDTALARGHCGMWDWDLARGRIIWSRSMYEMLGIPSSEGVMGFGELQHLLHGEDGDLLSLADSVFHSDSKQIDHRFRMMHSSGSWVWVRLRAELVYYRAAHPHLIGIAVDISEQEALKQKTRDADIRLRDAIENVSEAFVLWDAGKRLVLCNSKYQQLYNLPDSAIVSGTAYDEIQSVSRKPRIKTQITSEVRQDRDAQTFEAQIEDGRWLQINEKRTRDGGFVSLGTDITQIKRNEEKLVDSERRHMATIADLRNTKQELERQAQKLVEFADTLKEEKARANAANEAKSDFLANISHELRTPLNAIIGFSDIMRSGMFGPLGSDKYGEYADDIHESGSFLLGVINDVLDMSKIEAGRMLLTPESVDVHKLLEETLRIVQVQADDAEISVGRKIPEGLELEADRRAVKQILLNLLSNAVKFTPPGGRIEVTAKRLRSSINIVVEDNGCGISRESLKRLGQPFEQVQDQFTKDHKGSGLGLAIARSLAKLHGGTLKIRSVVGKGTLVAVRLPCECHQPEQVTEDEMAAA